MKIKSITDIITNSSSEVFCYKIDQEYEDLKKAVPEMEFTEFKTLEDIRKFVTSKDYYGWEFSGYEIQCSNGEENVPEPEYDFYSYDNEWLIERLKKSGKTDDEIWDFFKVVYENILGYAFLYLGEGSRDVSWRNKFKKWDWGRYCDKLENYLTSNFKPGDIMAVKEKYGGVKNPVLIKYLGKLEVDKPYSPELNKEFYEKEDLMEGLIQCLDYFTATKATEEQINEYNNFYSNK